MKAGLVLLACVALGACSDAPEAAEASDPGAAVAVALASPQVDARGATFPIRLKNEGTGALASATVDCSFSDAAGALLYTGRVQAGRLAPGAEHVGTITVPADIAARIGGLNCTQSAR